MSAQSVRRSAPRRRSSGPANFVQKQLICFRSELLAARRTKLLQQERATRVPFQAAHPSDPTFLFAVFLNWKAVYEVQNRKSAVQEAAALRRCIHRSRVLPVLLVCGDVPNPLILLARLGVSSCGAPLSSTHTLALASS